MILNDVAFPLTFCLVWVGSRHDHGVLSHGLGNVAVVSSDDDGLASTY